MFCIVTVLMILRVYAAAAAKSLQSCPTLCDPIDDSSPVSPVPGILQARTLEWVAISFSNAWQWKVKVKSLCRARLLATPWTAAFQAPPSMGFSRQEYWSGVYTLSQHTKDFPGGPVIGDPHASEGVVGGAVCGCMLSCVQLSAFPWTVAHQAARSMEFSRKEYWSGLPFPSPGDLPNPGIKPAPLVSPALAVDSLPLHHLGP